MKPKWNNVDNRRFRVFVAVTTSLNDLDDIQENDSRNDSCGGFSDSF